MASIIYEGLLDAVPGLKIVIAHGGGYFPYCVGRVDRNVEKPEAQVNIGDKKPSDYLRHFYYDTCVFDAPALAALFQRVGADRILLGADYPVGEDDPVGVVKSAVTLSNADLRMVAGGTAARLLGIEAAQKVAGRAFRLNSRVAKRQFCCRFERSTPPLASHDIPIGSSQVSLAQLNERSREIFKQIVESYLATGEPVGSRNISRIISMPLSPASVRNVMSDLEHLGLVYAPHTSAGRLPTEFGFAFFVDALMEVGNLTEEDRRSIEAQAAAGGAAKPIDTVLSEVFGAAVRGSPARPASCSPPRPTRGSSTSSSCGSSRSGRWW